MLSDWAIKSVWPCGDLDGHSRLCDVSVYKQNLVGPHSNVQITLNGYDGPLTQLKLRPLKLFLMCVILEAVSSYTFCSVSCFAFISLAKKRLHLGTLNQLTTIPVSFCSHTSRVLVTSLGCYVQFMNLSFNFLHGSVICYYKGPEKLGAIWIKLDTFVSDDGANLLGENINTTKKKRPTSYVNW